MLIKNTVKKIRKSFGRYLSLVIIIFIGVSFYAGIRQSIPDISNLEDEFVTETNMMDFRVQSTLGITDDDIEAMAEVGGVEYAVGGYSEYVFADEYIINVLSINYKVNKYVIREGRAPVGQGECLGYAGFYSVGDTVTVKDSELLTRDTFTVTGLVDMPLYISEDLGSANIGSGELSAYILVMPEVFDSEVYTEAYVTFDKTEDMTPYTDEYDEKADAVEAALEEVAVVREAERYDELMSEARETAREEVDKRYDEIWDEVYDEVYPEVYEEVYAEVSDRVNAEIEAKKAEQEQALRDKASLLGTTVEELLASALATGQSYVYSDDDIQRQIDEAVEDAMDSAMEEAMSDAMETAMDEAYETAYDEIDIPECEWYIEDRGDAVSSYEQLSDQYAEVEKIADIIPIFFIIIVALMTTNTMSRMIAEERGEIGTLSSLGVGTGGIIGSYLVYVLSATVIGCVAGYFAGIRLLPDFVYTCFPINLMGLKFLINLKMLALITLISMLTMVGVTVYCCLMILRDVPASLMRPLPPRTGKVILIERVKGLWKHLSFSWKITLRNVSRYKTRVLMTIVGTAGCTFLIFIGFAIRDSVNGIGSVQFTDVIRYDGMAVLSEGVSKFADFDDILEDALDKDSAELGIENPLMLGQQTITVTGDDGHKLSVYLMVPESSQDTFKSYFNLTEADNRDVGRGYSAVKESDDEQDTSSDDESAAKYSSVSEGDELSLTNYGVIITPGIASLMDVCIGDTFTFTDSDDTEYTVTVEGVAKNHVSDYVYMTRALYRELTGEGITFNTVVFATDRDKDILTEQLYEADEIVNVTFADTMLEKANSAVSGLDGVVGLLVVIASMLCFTVLYNLTAISISERTREIATLKVLGFTDSETNDYIYRETLISVGLGIAVGLLAAPLLHGFVLDIISNDGMVFIREIQKESFIYAGVLTLIFALVMMLVTYIRLQRVNMIESLKAVE